MFERHGHIDLCNYKFIPFFDVYYSIVKHTLGRHLNIQVLALKNSALNAYTLT